MIIPTTAPVPIPAAKIRTELDGAGYCPQFIPEKPSLQKHTDPLAVRKPEPCWFFTAVLY